MTHLVTGATGQDGVLLARLLVARGERVAGLVRPGSTSARTMAPYLEGVELVECDLTSPSAVAAAVDAAAPAAVHHLAALSSVGRSWDEPEATYAVNGHAARTVLEVAASRDIPFVQASSSEIVGAGQGPVVTEATPVAPVNPYGEAKAAAHRAVADARASGAHATNLVLFGHTSALQAPSFVLPTITRQAAEVALGRRDRIELRDPSVARDWGAAVDVVRAFVAAPDAPAGDYVIATGELQALGEVAAWALSAAGVASSEPAAASGEAARPHDVTGLVGDASSAAAVLGWRPATPLRKVIEHMVHVELERLRSGVAQAPSYLPG